MSQATHFFYSPFACSQSFKEKEKALLLQFILKEILTCYQENKDEDFDKILSKDPSLFPYDWLAGSGSLNRIKEHLKLLPIAFPGEKENLFSIQKGFDKGYKKLQSVKKKKNILSFLKELPPLLMPFLILCKEECLLYFILSNQREILELFAKEDICALFLPSENNDSLLQNFQKRGFVSLLPQISSLLNELEKFYER